MPPQTNQQVTLTVGVRQVDDLRTAPIRRVYVGTDYRRLISRALSELDLGQQLAWVNLERGDQVSGRSGTLRIPEQRRPVD